MKINNDFLSRTLVTLILGPIVVWSVLHSYYLNTYIFEIVMAICLWEWAKLCRSSSKFSQKTWLARGIFIVGVVYISLAFLFLTSIFVRDKESPYLLLWLLSLVWAVDIGAYLVGRWLQGPLLSPKISPAKTWSGFWGGTLSGIMTSTIFIYLTDLAIIYSPWIYIWGGVLTFVAPLGDLLESACKRYFKVKDTGILIPGHGGMLDRLDSFLAATLALKGFLLLKNNL